MLLCALTMVSELVKDVCDLSKKSSRISKLALSMYNPVSWIAGTCFDIQSILDWACERVRKAVYVKPLQDSLASLTPLIRNAARRQYFAALQHSGAKFGMRHEPCGKSSAVQWRDGYGRYKCENLKPMKCIFLPCSFFIILAFKGAVSRDFLAFFIS